MTEFKDCNLENAVHYHYDQFPPSFDKINSLKIFTAISEAAEVVGRFDQMLQNMHNSEFLIAPLKRREAILSSRMEGTISTMDEMLQYEIELRDIKTKNETTNTRIDTVETYLYYDSLQKAQDVVEGGYPISEAMLRMLHKNLLSVGRGASKTPGQYKTDQNYIANPLTKTIQFIPINPVALSSGLENLFDYIASSKHPPLIKAAIAHVEFEALHPFKDGNGRIGRMLITLMLWQSKIISQPHFYISQYFEANKDEYIDTMKEVSESGAWDKWCLFFLKAVKIQSEKNLEITQNIKNLYDNMKDVFREKLRSKYHDQCLDYLFTNPIFRNSHFTSNATIPPKKANEFTKILLEEGMLITLKEASGRRAALYGFSPLLQEIRI